MTQMRLQDPVEYMEELRFYSLGSGMSLFIQLQKDK